MLGHKGSAGLSVVKLESASIRYRKEVMSVKKIAPDGICARDGRACAPWRAEERRGSLRVRVLDHVAGSVAVVTVECVIQPQPMACQSKTDCQQPSCVLTLCCKRC